MGSNTPSAPRRQIRGVSSASCTSAPFREAVCGRLPSAARRRSASRPASRLGRSSCACVQQTESRLPSPRLVSLHLGDFARSASVAAGQGAQGSGPRPRPAATLQLAFPLARLLRRWLLATSIARLVDVIRRDDGACEDRLRGDRSRLWPRRNALILVIVVHLFVADVLVMHWRALLLRPRRRRLLLWRAWPSWYWAARRRRRLCGRRQHRRDQAEPGRIGFRAKIINEGGAIGVAAVHASMAA